MYYDILIKYLKYLYFEPNFRKFCKLFSSDMIQTLDGKVHRNRLEFLEFMRTNYFGQDRLKINDLQVKCKNYSFEKSYVSIKIDYIDNDYCVYSTILDTYDIYFDNMTLINKIIITNSNN